jgi:hypothetical protein
MYLHYQLMKTLQDERLRGAARDHLAAEARRARTAGRDHAAATRPGATVRGAATMHRTQIHPGRADRRFMRVLALCLYSLRRG